MQKRYARFSGLPIFVLAVILLGSKAHADDTSSFNDFIQSLHTHRAAMELKFGVGYSSYPHATCYYDDLVDHYEQDQLMRDVIAEGIR